MSNQRKKAKKMEIEIMEKEILHLKGIRQERAKKAYYKLVQECRGTCRLDEPIYLMKIE